MISCSSFSTQNVLFRFVVIFKIEILTLIRVSILNIFNQYKKIYIYLPSLHRNLYQKIIKCFSYFIPIHIIPNNLNEEDVDVVIEEIVNNRDFEKSNTELETYESIEELKFPQEYEDGGIVILDNINEEK